MTFKVSTTLGEQGLSDALSDGQCLLWYMRIDELKAQVGPESRFQSSDVQLTLAI